VQTNSSQTLLDEYAGIVRQLIEVEQDLADNRARQAELERALQDAEKFVTRQVRTINPVWQKAHEQLAAAQSELAARRLVCSERHPAVQALEREIAEKRSLLESLEKLIVSDEETAPNPVYDDLVSQLTDVRSTIAGLEERRSCLMDSEKAKRSRMRTYPSEMSKSLGYAAELGAERKEYGRIVEKLPTLRHTRLLEIEERSTRYRPLALTRLPTTPLSPNIRLILILGLMVGMMLAATHVSLAEYVDHSLRGVNDVGRHLDLPVLGAITDFRYQYPEVRKKHEASAKPPSFRRFKIMGLSLAGFGMLVLVVASAALIALLVIVRPRLDLKHLRRLLAPRSETGIGATKDNQPVSTASDSAEARSAEGVPAAEPLLTAREEEEGSPEEPGSDAAEERPSDQDEEAASVDVSPIASSTVEFLLGPPGGRNEHEFEPSGGVR